MATQSGWNLIGQKKKKIQPPHTLAGSSASKRNTMNWRQYTVGNKLLEFWRENINVVCKCRPVVIIGQHKRPCWPSLASRKALKMNDKWTDLIGCTKSWFWYWATFWWVVLGGGPRSTESYSFYTPPPIPTSFYGLHLLDTLSSHRHIPKQEEFEE